MSRVYQYTESSVTADVLAAGNRFKYQSNWMYLKEGVYLSPARLYHAQYGSFLQQDPLYKVGFLSHAFAFNHIQDTAYDKWKSYSFALGTIVNYEQIGSKVGVNSFAYGQNNPVIYVDSAGLSSKECKCGPDITTWLQDTISYNIKFTKKWFKSGWSGLGRPLSTGGMYEAWYNLVKTGGPWDFKLPLLEMVKNSKDCGGEPCTKTVTLCGECVQYEAISNIHYGILGRYATFAEEILNMGAGIAQVKDHSNKWIKVLNGHWGDEPEDAAAVDIGYKVYDGTSLCTAVKGNLSTLKKTPEGCKPCSETGAPNVKKVKSIRNMGKTIVTE